MEDVGALQRWIREQRDRHGWSGEDLAGRARAFALEEGLQIKLTQQSISAFEKGDPKRVPVWIRYVRMAFEAAEAETKEDPHLTMEGGDHVVMIERLPTEAGAGAFSGTGEGDRQLRSFSGSLVRELGVRPEDLLLIEIEGDSMIPEFFPGDQMLVNRRKVSLAQPGPFCLWDGDGYVVKYLEKVAGSDPPKIRVISGNPRYSSGERLIEEVQIMGRVVWFARRI